MEEKTVLTVVGLILLTMVVMYCLFLGEDGIILASYVGIVAYVLGLPSGAYIQQKRQ